MLQVDQARVKELLDYDEVSGLFTWRKKPRRRTIIGAAAGCVSTHLGYVLIGFDKHRFYAHRLAWLYVNGEWPPHEIDHINGIRTDNRIVNLRLATRVENAQNGWRQRSMPGLRGTYLDKRKLAAEHRRPWAGRIRKDGKTIYLGSFATTEEAHAAYVKAANELHGQFARTE